MPGISVEKLVLSMVISRFMRFATSVKRSIWKPSMPPPSLGMACGAKVPSTPVRSGGFLVLSRCRPHAQEGRDRDRSQAPCHHFKSPFQASPGGDVRSAIVE
jgi:hypothetical protein